MLHTTVVESLRTGKVPLMVANTCSTTLTSWPAAALTYPSAHVLWIDAHGDFNTSATTESGYLGDMVLAAACRLWDRGHGAGLRPERVILTGGHDIDPAEDELLAQAGVHRISSAEAPRSDPCRDRLNAGLNSC